MSEQNELLAQSPEQLIKQFVPGWAIDMDAPLSSAEGFQGAEHAIKGIGTDQRPEQGEKQSISYFKRVKNLGRTTLETAATIPKAAFNTKVGKRALAGTAAVAVAIGAAGELGSGEGNSNVAQASGNNPEAQVSANRKLKHRDLFKLLLKIYPSDGNGFTADLRMDETSVRIASNTARITGDCPPDKTGYKLKEDRRKKAIAVSCMKGSPVLAERHSPYEDGFWTGKYKLELVDERLTDNYSAWSRLENRGPLIAAKSVDNGKRKASKVKFEEGTEDRSIKKAKLKGNKLKVTDRY